MILVLVDSSCLDCSVRIQTLSWLVRLGSLGGKGEELVLYPPFTIPRRGRCTLIIPFLRVASSFFFILSQVTGGCIFSCPRPGRACAEPISVCRNFTLKSFFAKLDAPLGCLLQEEGASSAGSCKFMIRPLTPNKGTVQVVSRLYHKVLLKSQK